MSDGYRGMEWANHHIRKLESVCAERDQLLEALEEFVKASSGITSKVRIRYAAHHGIDKADAQFNKLYTAQVDAELLLKNLQEAKR